MRKNNKIILFITGIQIIVIIFHIKQVKKLEIKKNPEKQANSGKNHNHINLEGEAQKKDKRPGHFLPTLSVYLTISYKIIKFEK